MSSEISTDSNPSILDPRSLRSKARLFSRLYSEENNPSVKEVKDLGADWGDLLILSDPNRCTKLWVVSFNSQCLDITNEWGWGIIPLAISNFITDPIAFYANQIGKNILTISIDTTIHATALMAITGGRAVHASRKIEFTLNNCVEFASGERKTNYSYIIRSPFSEDIFKDYHYVVLNEFTPIEYLENTQSLLMDPFIEKERIKNRELYEVRAHLIFPMKVGKSIFISLPPSLIGEEIASGESGVITQVEFSSTNPTQVTRVLAEDGAGESIWYSPRILTEKGPFGGVYLWASDKIQHRNWSSPMSMWLSLWKL